MSSSESSKQRRPSRKLTEKRQGHGSTSMDLPERFQDDDDDDEQGDDRDEPKGEDASAMHQSIFGMIAAAQSKNDFRSAEQESRSESEAEEEEQGMAKAVPKDQDPSETATSARLPEASQGRSKPAKLLAMAASSSSRTTRSPTAVPAHASHETSNTASRSPSSRSGAHPLSKIDSPGRDAPVMSQMLEARAKADIDASVATLKAPQSTDDSPADSTTLLKAPLALPDALKDIFHFDESEEVISEYPCWYLQSVLLQGYMYITQRHVCFYAYLQQKSNVTIKSGYMSKRGKRNPHYNRYWFVLKGTILSYYADPSTPYFPSGNIDLRYGISAEVIKDKDKAKDATYFSVTTDERAYYFKADSTPSAKEWVKQLQKVIFRSHNDGDSIKISLPIENILDVDENPVIDSAETIKIRVIDNDETYAVDEYFFSFFSSGKDALSVLKVMTQDTAASKAGLGQSLSPNPELTSHRPLVPCETSPRLSIGRTPPLPVSAKAALPRTSATNSPRVSGEFDQPTSRTGRSSVDLGQASFDQSRGSSSAGNRVRFDRSQPPSPPPGSLAVEASSESFPDSSDPPSRQSGAESELSEDTSASQMLSESRLFHKSAFPRPRGQSASSGSEIERLRGVSQDTVHSTLSSKRARIQPSSRTLTEQSVASANDGDQRSSLLLDRVEERGPRPGMQRAESSAFGGIMRAGAYPIKGASGIAGIIKNQSKRVSKLLGTSPMDYYGKVSGMWTGGKRHYTDADGLQSEDHVYDPDEESDTLGAEMRFREYFALPDSERLVASYFGHLLRVLPLYGKVYIGSSKLCFRSMLPGTRTKLVIPFKDILNVDKEKGFRFGYSGMVVVIRGHEEVFVEFASAGLRDDCTITVLRLLDRLKNTQESLDMTDEEKHDSEVAANEDVLLRTARQEGQTERDMRLPRNLSPIELGAPPILFDDTAASVLDFKPQESLRITCLTIGSRGDVQPYIALCKGFLAEGHRPKIATHREFEPWVKKHGIDFAPVDGDPAELMRICVDNGMFTPSFMYEANSKFRGFLDTLLTTSWTACQDSDVLIESPSAMGGIHVAEALGIPYFRAFTMPWTRTRAYPHAFAVPNHKMGGAYNYMTYVFFDNLFWQSTAGQVNRWRRKSLGLRPTTLDKLQPNKVPFLYNFSPSVVPPPLDFSDWIRVTGYWFLDEATDWTPPKDLLDFINSARADKMPLVYIGFGSVVVSDSAQMTQNIVDAVLKADVRCILSKGWSDRLDKKDASAPEVPLPACMFQISSAPHDWLFRQIDAAVHHGGAGTTGASLRAGVPTIIKPFFGDQFFFGNRVHDLGVGMHIKRVTPNALGRALWIACHDARMRDKARLLGEQIRQERGVDTAIKAVYRDMEYAKSLVKTRERVGEAVASKEAGQDDDGDDDDDDGDVDDEDDMAGESWTFVEEDNDTEAAAAAATGTTTTADPARSAMRGVRAWDAMQLGTRSPALAFSNLAARGRE